ncbi:hypothetical protein EXS70_05265 [Candidatus Peribacteria bacterium]|nr:hypothetical protein [Candidatus Peribacteria bacterium]
MHIELHLPRPGVTLLAIFAVTGWTLFFSNTSRSASVVEAPPMEIHTDASSSIAVVALPVASSVIPYKQPVTEEEESHLSSAEMRIKWARAEQEFLRQKQDIIREQLEGLQKEREALGPNISPALEEQFRRSVQMFTSLVKDEEKAEQFMLTSYRQEWEAEERAIAASTGAPDKPVSLYWPVEPALGISAYFLDTGYKQRFKVEHYAIDIPVAQGTDILAAGDGIVTDVVDHGLGYNYITINHGGYATVYGHVSEFSVRPGQRVRLGDRIGKSGGMPGLPGGGSSTGPHVHFGVYVNGSPVDPLRYLPKF